MRIWPAFYVLVALGILAVVGFLAEDAMLHREVKFARREIQELRREVQEARAILRWCPREEIVRHLPLFREGTRPVFKGETPAPSLNYELGDFTFGSGTRIPADPAPLPSKEGCVEVQTVDGDMLHFCPGKAGYVPEDFLHQGGGHPLLPAEGGGWLEPAPR